VHAQSLSHRALGVTAYLHQLIEAWQDFDWLSYQDRLNKIRRT